MVNLSKLLQFSNKFFEKSSKINYLYNTDISGLNGTDPIELLMILTTFEDKQKKSNGFDYKRLERSIFFQFVSLMFVNKIF